VIAGLARAQAPDIERAAEAVREAERPRIHTFISTSDIHIEHQLQSTRDDVKGSARAAVAHAKSFVDDVEFSPMDATRADVEFTAEVLQIALDEGATTINIPDTVGYATPQEYAGFLTRLYELVPGLAKSCFPCTATTTSGWRWRTRSPACRPARARSSALSTGSASAPATHRSRSS
jgi:2-isopropylmalate synthase